MKYSWKQTFALIATDWKRYVYLQRLDFNGGRRRWIDYPRAIVLSQGLQASIVYRIGHHVHNSDAPFPLRTTAKLILFFAQRWIEMTTGISISPRATIGRGLYIGHFGGIIVGAATLGDNCNISHGVTIGRGVVKGTKGQPTLGDRVWLGPGAKVYGPIHVGEDVAVGANAVINTSIPPRSLAAGVPATIRPDHGSFDILVYEGMEGDVNRSASLGLLMQATAGTGARSTSTSTATSTSAPANA